MCIKNKEDVNVNFLLLRQNYPQKQCKDTLFSLRTKKKDKIKE